MFGGEREERENMHNCETFCSFNKISKFEMIRSHFPDLPKTLFFHLVSRSYTLNFHKGETKMHSCYFSPGTTLKSVQEYILQEMLLVPQPYSLESYLCGTLLDLLPAARMCTPLLEGLLRQLKLTACAQSRLEVPQN